VIDFAQIIEKITVDCTASGSTRCTACRKNFASLTQQKLAGMYFRSIGESSFVQSRKAIKPIAKILLGNLKQCRAIPH
jgi:hypothetical protein